MLPPFFCDTVLLFRKIYKKYSIFLLTKTKYKYIIFNACDEECFMNIQLEQIFNLEGSKKEFDFCFEPEYTLSDDISLDTPGIAVSGKIENRTGIVSLSGSAKFSATVVCSRCAEGFKKDFQVDFEHLLANNLMNEENDDYIVVENSVLDLSSLVCEDIIFSLPLRFLCDEECKGLCSKCGKNLNNGPCDCKKDVDPRMAALLQLLED